MDQKYSIDILKLSNGKYLIYPYLPPNYRGKTGFTIQEYNYLYDEWLNGHSITLLEDIVLDVCAWQIDGLVHLYMHKYGIENVRGGRYNKLVISDEEKEHISDSIKYFAYGLDEANCEMDKCHTCLDEIVNGKMDLDNIHSEYEKYNQLNVKRENYEIDRSIMYEFEWLISIVKTPPTQFTQSIRTRYYTLTQSLRSIYAKYIRTFDDSSQKIASCYKKYSAYFYENVRIAPITEAQLANPIMYLDSRVISSERNHDYCPKDELFLDIFTLIIYTFVNREDEILYDIAQIDIENVNRARKIMAIYLKELEN